MVVCKLDTNISGEILGLRVPTWQAVLLNKVLPSCGGLVVYITVLCFDFSLIYEYNKNGDKGLAAFCLILMILPALICLVFTLATPPDGLKTEDTERTISVKKADIKWVLLQMLDFLIFPVVTIGRYCYSIFWWVEVVFACLTEDLSRAYEAIEYARKTSSVELYLFLQAFTHSAPLAIVNLLDLLYRYNADFDKVSIQTVSIISALLRMAATATLYRRFEREKVCGRKYPWKVNEKDKNDSDEEVLAKSEKDNIYNTMTKSHITPQTPVYARANSDLIQFSPRNTKIETNFETDSNTSSGYLSPSSKKSSLQSIFEEERTIQHRKASLLDSDEEYVRPISIVQRVAPLRKETRFDTRKYTIEKVDILPPPIIPAPRPGSIAVWAEKLVENAESIPMWLSAPPRRKHYHEVIQDEPDIPRRVPITLIRGLEPPDVIGSLIQFLGWYFFLVSRLISIAVFIHFFPVAAIIVLFSHYQVMVLFLIVPQASTVRRGFYIFLAFIYLFCLMEFKIRFRHVRVWHTFWFIVCTIETVIFTGLWASINNSFDHWWKDFIVKVIIVSTSLSYMCFLTYFLILKPRETVVNLEKKSPNE